MSKSKRISRHDEPSPRRGRRDGKSRGTRRGGPQSAAARWWRLPRPLTVACLGARPPSRPLRSHPTGRPPWRRTRRGPGPRPPRAPRPRRRSRRALRRRTPRRRRAVRPSAWTNGPGRTRGPRKQTRRPVRASLAHAPDARARRVLEAIFDGSSKTRTVRFSRHVHGARRARRHADDEDVMPEERPEKPRANARRGRHGRANTVRKILTNLVRVSRLYIKTQGSASRRRERGLLVSVFDGGSTARPRAAACATPSRARSRARPCATRPDGLSRGKDPTTRSRSKHARRRPSRRRRRFRKRRAFFSPAQISETVRRTRTPSTPARSPSRARLSAARRGATPRARARHLRRIREEHLRTARSGSADVFRFVQGRRSPRAPIPRRRLERRTNPKWASRSSRPRRTRPRTCGRTPSRTRRKRAPRRRRARAVMKTRRATARLDESAERDPLFATRGRGARGRELPSTRSSGTRRGSRGSSARWMSPRGRPSARPVRRRARRDGDAAARAARASPPSPAPPPPDPRARRAVPSRDARRAGVGDERRHGGGAARRRGGAFAFPRPDDAGEASDADAASRGPGPRRRRSAGDVENGAPVSSRRVVVVDFPEGESSLSAGIAAPSPACAPGVSLEALVREKDDDLAAGRARRAHRAVGPARRRRRRGSHGKRV